MQRITFDDLMARLEGRPAPAAAAAPDETDWDLLRARQAKECSLGGVAMLLNVALLATAVEDFPSTIPLGPMFSGQEDLRLECGEDDVWRLTGPVDAVLDADLNPPRRTLSLGAVLTALGVEGTNQTIAALDSVANWRTSKGIELATKLAHVAPHVQDHVLSASLGHGERLFKALGIGHGDMDLHDAWVEAVLLRGIDVNAPPAPGMAPPPVMALLSDGYESFHSLMRNGGDIRVRDAHGLTPLLAAFRAGHFNALKRCVDWGAKVPEEVGLDGRTVLHCAAEAAAEGLRTSDFLDQAHGLVAMGVDPRAQDNQGRTAADIVKASPYAEVRAMASDIPPGATVHRLF